VFLFGNFLFVAKSGYQPLEDVEKVGESLVIIPKNHLDKSGYKPNMKLKAF
jgi:hypothetical protein